MSTREDVDCGHACMLVRCIREGRSMSTREDVDCGHAYMLVREGCLYDVAMHKSIAPTNAT